MTIPSTPGMSWGPVASLGGQLTGNPAVAPSSDGRLEVFARGRADKAPSTCHQQTWGGWSEWENLGAATLAGDPSALHTAARRIGVFFKNGQGNLEHPWQTVINGGHGAGRVLADNIGGDPVPGLHADGRPAAFFRGTDNALWHVRETTKSGYGNWTGPAALGGTLSGDPAVATDARGRLQVFFRGIDGHLWVVRQRDANNNAWESPQNIVQNVGGDPVVGTNADGRLEVFFRGTDNALWHLPQTDDYNGWTTLSSLGGILSGNPAVARAADARLAAFHWGGGHLWVNEQTIVNGTDWSAWEQIAQNIGGEPVVEADGHGRLDVFFHGTDHAVWHIAQMFGQPAAGYATSP
ncbi:hypothetical protein ACWGKA_02325 [Streptomyces luteogriseus]